MQDAAGSVGGVEEDGQKVIEAGSRQAIWDFEGMRRKDVHALVEEAVATHAIPGEAGHLSAHLERRPAVDARCLHPRRLAGWVVGHLVLEEDVGAVIPVPDHLVLLIVLDEKAVRGHVVTVDDDAGVRGVFGPTHAIAVVGSPRPDVVEDDVVAVDDQACLSLAWRRATDAEEHIGKSCRVGGCVVVTSLPVVTSLIAAPDLQQHPGVPQARVKDDPREHDPLRALHRHRDDAVLRHQGWEAEPEHHGVGARDLDAPVQLIDARSEDEVLAAAQRVIDFVRGVCRLGDEEVLDRQGRARRLATAPRRARGVVLDGRNEHVELLLRVLIQVRRFPRHGAGCEGRVLVAAWEALGGRAHDTGEHLVPDAVGPRIDLTVPGHPLLLRPVDHFAAVEL